MSLLKISRDFLRKLLLEGGDVVPRELLDLHEYFRLNGPIHFAFHGENPEAIVAVSTNFRYGSIVSSGRDAKELDKNIRDAILTTFDVPSSYSKEANVMNVKNSKNEYALA